MLGVVTLNSTVGEHEWLRQEARRIALLLQMARDEAIVRDRPSSLELDEYRYFLSSYNFGFPGGRFAVGPQDLRYGI